MTTIDVIANLKARGVRIVAEHDELLWEANLSFWCDGCGSLVPYVHPAAKRCRAMRTVPCRGCGDPMVWATTEKGKSMPVDPEPVSRSLVGPKALLFDLEEDDERDAHGRRKNPVARLTHGPEGHIAHWSSCSKREDFKKKKDEA